jgi:uncharacterized protein involved in outer membrane biogenesis
VRKALYGAVILAVLGVAGVWLAFNYLDVLVKWTLEHYGPDVTGTPVHVGDVHISPRDGRGVVRGLEIGNPPGFSSGRAVRLGEVRLALDPATLMQDVVLVHELVLESPQVVYEKGAKTTNLDAIQERIEAYVKKLDAEEGSTSKAGDKPRSGKRRFIVERLVIRGAHVTMTNSSLRGQGLGFDLPDVQLADVGRKRGGLTASEVAQVVASTLQQKIAQKLLTNLDLLRRGGVEGAVDALKGLLK